MDGVDTDASFDGSRRLRVWSDEVNGSWLPVQRICLSLHCYWTVHFCASVRYTPKSMCSQMVLHPSCHTSLDGAYVATNSPAIAKPKSQVSSIRSLFLSVNWCYSARWRLQCFSYASSNVPLLQSITDSTYEISQLLNFIALICLPCCPISMQIYAFVNFS